MTPFNTKDYLTIFGWIAVIVTMLTVFQMTITTIEQQDLRERNTQTEMSKRGYCLKSTLGTTRLTYQPCITEIKPELK